MKKDHIILILRVLVGVVFIFSGISKLDSIYQFEQAIFKAGVTDWAIIPYLSRFIIAFEILLGICFFHYEGLKKFTIPATFLLLVVFCIHLGYTIYTEGGNSGNCGCFGNKLPMTPNESLLKNIITMGILVYLYRVPIIKPAREVFIPISLGAFSFIFVFFFFPIKEYVTTPVSRVVETKTDTTQQVQVTTTATNDSLSIEKSSIVDPGTKVPTESTKKDAGLNKETKQKNTTITVVEPKVEANKPPRVTSKYASFKNFSNGGTTNLDEGKKIVCMYNTGCDHCMENARKMCELNKKGILPPVYILFWGSESEVPAFFDFAKCSFPYTILEPQVFFPLLGAGNFPKVSYLHEGNILGEWEGDNFSQEKLTEALSK